MYSLWLWARPICWYSIGKFSRSAQYKRSTCPARPAAGLVGRPLRWTVASHQSVMQVNEAQKDKMYCYCGCAASPTWLPAASLAVLPLLLVFHSWLSLLPPALPHSCDPRQLSGEL